MTMPLALVIAVCVGLVTAYANHRVMKHFAQKIRELK